MCTLGQTKFSCCRTCWGDGELALLAIENHHFLVNRLNFLSRLKKKNILRYFVSLGNINKYRYLFFRG